MAETVEKTRIYVGGLGGGVTEDDLRKTFSSLGDVIDVDIVRTKDRSFAYLDFIPSSDKSLPKLFSTYNGCMWKGGRLKLEKAKEHYLLRLKREWQEESELASKASDSCKAVASESNAALQKPKKPSPADKTQFQIYFPKLGKVKSLGQVGIGKHKYSFQRIQVPDMPTHFCDCEEHSRAFPPPLNKKQSSELEKASYEINEQELDIMNSVMNRILGKANPPKQVSRKSEAENVKDELVAAENDEEDNLTDEDNLVINVGNGESDTMDLIGEMRTMMAKRAQESVAKRQTISTEKSKSEKKTLPLAKKRKSPHSEENDSSKPPIPETSKNSQTRLDTRKDSKTKLDSGSKQAENNISKTLIPETSRNSQTHLDTRKDSKTEMDSGTKQLENNISKTPIPETSRNSQTHLDTRKDSKTKVESGTKKPDNNSLRALQFSWKGLIGQTRKTSFDISNFIATMPQRKEEELKVDDTDHSLKETKLVSNKKRKSDGDKKEPALHKNKEPATEADALTTETTTLDILANDCQQKEEEPKADNLDILANDCQQKEEEPKADDVEMPLATIGQQFSITYDAGDIDEKGEEPKTDNIEMPLTTIGQQFSITDVQQKEEEPKADDVEMPLTSIGQQFSITDVAGDIDERSQEPKTDNDEIPLTTLGQQFSITDVVGDLDQKEEEPKVDNVEMPLTTISQQFSITDVAGDLDQKEEEPRTDDLNCNFGNAKSQFGNSNDLKKPSDEDLIRTARGDFWRHKSSWTQLISTTSHTSFSISQIVPDVNFEKLEQKTDTLNSQPANKNLGNQDQSSVGKEINLLPVKKKTSEKRRIVSSGNLESEGMCSFMRTDESMKEWKKAKMSHSSSLNKKKKQANEAA